MAVEFPGLAQIIFGRSESFLAVDVSKVAELLAFVDLIRGTKTTLPYDRNKD